MSATNSTFPPGYLDEYIGFKLVWLSSAFIAIDFFFVGLRFYARYMSRTSIGADDYITFFSLVCAIALSAIGICEWFWGSLLLNQKVWFRQILAVVKYGGVGYHFAAMLARPDTRLGPFKKLTFIFANVYIASVMFPKVAMLCFFLRIFVQPWHRRACYILMGILIATAVATLIANLIQCVPLEFAWDAKAVAGAYCFKQQLFWSLISVPNIITDLVMLALPVPVIYKIQLSWKDKVGLILTFATGSM